MGASKYPWDKWLETYGPQHISTFDLGVTPRHLQILINPEAKKRGIRVRTRMCQEVHEIEDWTGTEEVVGECLIIERTGKPKRDWDELLDGKVHIVFHSEIAPVKPTSFIRTARAAAAHRKLRLVIDQRTNPSAMSLIALPKRTKREWDRIKATCTCTELPCICGVNDDLADMPVDFHERYSG